MKFQHSEVLKLLNLRDDESFENEEMMTSSKMSAHSDLSSRIMSSFFFTIYTATKNMTIAVWWGFFVIFYSALQLLALSFIPADGVTANPTFVWLSNQIGVITGRGIATASTTAVRISFIIVLITIFMTLLVGLYIAKQFWFVGHAQSPTAGRILGLLLHLQTTVLFMPFITILSATLSCSSGVTLCDGSVAHYLISTLAACVLIVFVALMSFVVLLACENNPVASNALASPHGRVHTIACIIMALMNILSTLLGNTSALARTVVTLIGGLAIAWLYIQHLPYCMPRCNRFASAMYSMAAWGGLCILVTYLLDDSSRQIFVVSLLMGLPIIFIAVYLYIMVREMELGRQEIQSGMSPYLVEIILRCKWRDEAYGARTSEYRKIVDEFYLEDAFMLLQMSTMFNASGCASLLAGQYMSKSNRCRKKTIDHRYFIFRAFRRQHDEKNSESGSLNYMTLKHHQTTAEANIVEALQQIQYLFDDLHDNNLVASELFAIAKKVDRASVRARESLDMLVKLTKSAPRTLLLYSLYASEIMFDFVLSKRLHKAAHESFCLNSADEQSHLDTVTMVISGNESNLGEILECSDNVEIAYGYVPVDIIGLNIDSLCPPPINNGVHERFLRHYIETAVNFVPVTRMVWIRHSEGYYIRCTLSVFPVQDEETGNLAFQGKLTKVQQDVDFVGISETGDILFYSQGVLKSFGLRSFFEKENGHNVKIQTVIPETSDIDFEEMFTKLENTPNYTETLLIESDGETYKLAIMPKSFPQARIKFVVIDMRLIEEKKSVSDSEEEFSDSDDSDDEKADIFQRMQSMSVRSMEDFGMKKVDEESGSVKSDSNSTVKAATKIRSAIRINIEIEKSRLDRFKVIAMAFAITFIGLTIVSVVANHLVFSNMANSILSFQLSGDRVYLIVESGTALLALLQPNITDDFFTVVRDTISSNADLIESTHDSILHQSASQSSIIRNLHYNSSLASEFHSDMTSSLTSFNSLVLEIVANMRAFLNLGISWCDVSCQYVINNANWDFVTIATDMISQYRIEVENSFGTMQIINLALVIFSGSVVLFLLFNFITPRLLEVKRVKDDVSASVGNIHCVTLKRICVFNSLRSQKVANMIHHINRSQNPFQLDQSQAGRDVRVGGGVHGMSSRSIRVQETHSAKSWLFCCRRRNGVHPSEKPKLAEQGLTRALVWSFAKMTIPLLFVVVYFAVIYFANDSLKSSAALYLNSMNANVIRWVDFQRLSFASHSPYADPPVWSRWYANETLYNETNLIEVLIKNISDSENLIKYGNKQGSGKPFIDKQATPELYDLYFVDACSLVEACVVMLETVPDDPLTDSMQNGLEVAIDGVIRTAVQFLKGLASEIISLQASFPFADANDMSLHLFEKSLDSEINNAQTSIVALSMLAILLIVLIFVFLVRVFRGINNEIVDAQSLFLLLPADVLDSIPELNRMIKNV